MQQAKLTQNTKEACNMPDKFTISFDKSHEDITVFATGLNNGKTDWIQPGSSVNLTVSYAFDQGADGDRTVTLIAESQQAGTVGQTVSAEGEADFKEKIAVMTEPEEIKKYTGSSS